MLINGFIITSFCFAQIYYVCVNILFYLILEKILMIINIDFCMLLHIQRKKKFSI